MVNTILHVGFDEAFKSVFMALTLSMEIVHNSGQACDF